jgi:hypothetical protein
MAQAVSPYYFAYEDLLEDWRAVQTQTQSQSQSQSRSGGGSGVRAGKQLPAEPKVSAALSRFPLRPGVS